MSTTSERLYRRDRGTIVAGIIILLALSWAYTLWIAWEVYGQGGHGFHAALGPHAGPWGIAELSFVLIMWIVMMTAMMVPSVSPTMVMFSKVSRNQGDGDQAIASTWVFVAGYLVAWSVFSLVATGAQWGLNAAALLTPVMETNNGYIGGAILLVAGGFQFTSLKNACLQHCRSPLTFFMSGWRPGRLGALNMGIRHGAFCVGCCWALMAVMFVGGVMNPLWLVALAVFVLAEKVLPQGARVGQAAGIAFIAAGLYLIIRF